MDVSDLLNGLASTTAQAASEVVANVFNATPGPFRPIALAALRVSVESAVATMDADDQRMYANTLERLQCTTVKKKKEVAP